MKKRGAILAVGLAVLGGYVWLKAEPAGAVAPFKREFEHKYVKEGTPFADLVDEAKCNICHQGESKKDRNAYGQALAKLLTKDDKEDVPKILQALEKVEAEKVDPKDPKSATFGERIRAGKLPAGD